MKTILVPTDFSANADNALLYAAALANFMHAQLLLVHVLYPSEDFVNVDPDLETNHPEIKIRREKLESTVRKIQNQHRYFFGFETLCIFEENLLVLNKIIKENNVHFAVMGTKGYSNYLDKLIGSNTFDFIKNAECPVLAVPAKSRFTEIKKIVYASDFASDETIFLKQLFVFAQLFQSEILILNVVTNNLLNNPSDKKIINSFEPYFSGHNYTIFQIQEEDAAQGILNFAETNKVEMVAISIHERSGLEAFFHKSVATSLVFYTTVPLLTLPANPYHTPPSVSTVDQIKAELLKK